MCFKLLASIQQSRRQDKRAGILCPMKHRQRSMPVRVLRINVFHPAPPFELDAAHSHSLLIGPCMTRKAFKLPSPCLFTSLIFLSFKPRIVLFLRLLLLASRKRSGSFLLLKSALLLLLLLLCPLLLFAPMLLFLPLQLIRCTRRARSRRRARAFVFAPFADAFSVRSVRVRR